MTGLEAFLASTLTVTLAEMGDKTQLLAFALSARFRRPWTVMLGIFIATVFNHLLAAAAGGWITQYIPPVVLAWGLGLSFIGFGVWTLIPDRYDENPELDKFGPLLTTIVLFFIAEIGDKTQLATVLLGARYANVVVVVLGTTLGMLIADGLAVFLGSKLERFVPLKFFHRMAAVLFVVLGVVTVSAFYVRL
ncbi:TMEM165/GDT1 family protein [Anthocerotibacter panamensis]|uniref:TMEM165/GDT1 family protein n=1 Tax=Anthocerotibacter panamensis TaxID=2857077 RepID=UPI001FDA676E|nr:TMEM165/GDT1 family protein [Anthocerotibacter panamensis]